MPDETFEPFEAPDFALILLRKGPDRERLVDAIAEIDKCSRGKAAVLANRDTPMVIKSDLTEAEAIWSQFELICCDAVSMYVRNEVIEQHDQPYLESLFRKVSDSPEFKPAAISIEQIPETEAGANFRKRFFGIAVSVDSLPMKLTVPFKKARIMEDWAARIGVEMTVTALHD